MQGADIVMAEQADKDQKNNKRLRLTMSGPESGAGPAGPHSKGGARGKASAPSEFGN